MWISLRSASICAHRKSICPSFAMFRKSSSTNSSVSATNWVFPTSSPDRWCAVPITRAKRCSLASFREVYPGVLSLALPLPFELESVNVFLVALRDGFVLIDCGMETEPAFETLSAALAERGIAWPEIREIILTHMHPDHMGMAQRLVQLTGAELAMHRTEAEHLQLIVGSARMLPWLQQAYGESGVPPALQTTMEEHFAAIRVNFHHLAPDQLFLGGE